jgi:hypothetical protein
MVGRNLSFVVWLIFSHKCCLQIKTNYGCQFRMTFFLYYIIKSPFTLYNEIVVHILEVHLFIHEVEIISMGHICSQ